MLPIPLWCFGVAIPADVVTLHLVVSFVGRMICGAYVIVFTLEFASDNQNRERAYGIMLTFVTGVTFMVGGLYVVAAAAVAVLILGVYWFGKAIGAVLFGRGNPGE